MRRGLDPSGAEVLDGPTLQAVADFSGRSFPECGAIVIIELDGNKQDVDLRLESENLQNMLVLDGSADKIGIGNASPTNARFEINQTVTDAAIACLNLNQDDVDETFIYFDGTSQTDSSGSVSSSTDTGGTKVGAVKVNINGTARWIRFYDTAV